MKRIVAITLALATLLVMLVACAEVEENPQESDAATEAEQTTTLDNIPEDLKFEEADITILNRAWVGWTWDEVAVPELNSEPVNDAMFNRNIVVGDRLNVNIVSAPIEDPDQFKPITEIERVVNAMFATMHNGLTLAKPDYAIKYLMDNCEVYEGMVAAEKLYSKVLVPAGAGSTATRDKLKNGVKQISDNIEKKMWNGSFYYPALGTDDRSAYTFSWTNFYPSATSQMFPIIFGLIDPSSDRAKTLYNTFCQHYDWENHDIPDSFYWGSNLQAAAKMGDVDRMKTYLTAYQKVAMRNHNYPLYNADAAKVSMAAYDIIQMAG